MFYKIITPSSEKELKEYYHLRWEVLRAPWGKEKGSEKDADENTSFHFAATAADGSVVGVCRLQKITDETGQIRFMAVKDNFRGSGVGALLLKHAEVKARETGLHLIQLQSRENAVNFYINNGYEMVEKTFLLFDEIQHYLMKKELL